MEIKYIKPLEDCGAIGRAAEDFGVDFPYDFIEFIKVNNGGRPYPNEIVIASGSEKVVNSFLSFNESDKDNVFKAKRRVSQDDETLFPFATDPSGDYFCLKEGKVVFYFSEDGEIINVAESFDDFMRRLK